VRNFCAVALAALVAYYGTRWAIGAEWAMHLSTVVAFVAMLLCWERDLRPVDPTEAPD